MRWEMEMEVVLDRIWDLHDKISDAIHDISRAHFLKSVKALSQSAREKKHPPPAAGGGGDGGSGFVYVKDFREEEDDAAMAEARSLNAIRTALENLEDQLEFFHTVQSQQQAERDAAIARLEQSRIILAMRLADHQGKKYKVIEEAMEFVGDVPDTGRFVSPENLYEMPRNQSGGNLEIHEGKRSRVLVQMLISGLALAKKSFRLERIDSVLGNAAIFAVSMLAFLQVHQVAFRTETLQIQDQAFYRRNGKNISRLDNSSQTSQMKHFDVLSARG
ncbi:plastid division protein PDV1-like [Phoenix dactylifera]|uniref:Plastid division protein PDV1-like n=1 Tax=Phoenix dactylifera TaxID=42345 RepID=A0A8B7BRG6_PHODC|nr:plastid division protein PDV1-like [Phoenix dactylifera]